jgi:sugar O-acyltransferase (sialic acid O-acetyltransferase NeuD family)
MAKVIIFGTSDFASLAHFYLRNDSAHEVAAFTVEREYMPDSKTFEGLPVVPFDEIKNMFPPTHYAGFAPMSHFRMNRLRERIYSEFKSKGYDLISYVSSKATQFPGVEIGDNCFILEDNTLQPFSRIGADVVLWSGNHVGHHSVLGNHTFVSSHVVISGHCMIGQNVFLGVNATIRDRVTLGDHTYVGMAAAVLRDTPALAVVKGNPGELMKITSERLDR